MHVFFVHWFNIFWLTTDKHQIATPCGVRWRPVVSSHNGSVMWTAFPSEHRNIYGAYRGLTLNTERLMIHTSDLMVTTRSSTYILITITREKGKVKTHSPIYCMKDDWKNKLNRRHTLDRIYMTGVLYVQCLHTCLQQWDDVICKQTTSTFRHIMTSSWITEDNF